MKVAFVVMPFGSLRPAIGPSLLQAELHAIGVESTIHYLNVRFAAQLGSRDYHYIADQAPSQSLAGDWVFSACVFGERPDADERYLSLFRERFPQTEGMERTLNTFRRARAQASTFVDACFAEVDWAQYDVVGFTSTFTQQVASLALAAQIKRSFPSLPIVFGGANCEGPMGLQLHRSFRFVDFVCSGEADLTFPRLVEALAVGSDAGSIPGVVARQGDRSCYTTLTPERVADLDSLPYPTYHDYFEQVAAAPAARAKATSVLVESSRGCWWGELHHCTFCGLNGSSMTYRAKSADRVLGEIEEQSRRYGATSVEMVDNILDMHYFDDLLPELERRKLDIGLFYETKANLRKSQVRQLRDAGVRAIQPGIESFSTDVLRIMRKGTSAAQNVQLLKWCKELGVKAFWNLIYGFPGEDPSAYEATATLIDALHHLDPPQGVGAIRLDRFSPNFFDAAELGLVDVRPDRSYPCIYDLPASDLDDLAYYFEHGYADGRDPASYTEAVDDAVARWHEDASGRGLRYADHGDVVAIWDFRANAARTLTILEGVERALYLFCDRHRGLGEIESAMGATDGVVDGAYSIVDGLRRLVEDRLMVELDGRYLSVACRLDGTAIDAAASPGTEDTSTRVARRRLPVRAAD